MTRTGKIARLPHNIRQQLNLRILDNEPGIELVAWLNSLPEAQAIIARDFGGRPVSEQNLTDWKQGGFIDWQNHARAAGAAITLAEHSREITETVGGSPADFLSTVIANQLAALLADAVAIGNAASADTLRMLTQITKNLVALRRADQGATRIRLAQANTAVAAARAEEHIVYKFRDWMKRANGWSFVKEKPLTEEERLARMTELLFGDRFSPDDIAQFIHTDPGNKDSAWPPETTPHPIESAPA